MWTTHRLKFKGTGATLQQAASILAVNQVALPNTVRCSMYDWRDGWGAGLVIAIPRDEPGYAPFTALHDMQVNEPAFDRVIVVPDRQVPEGEVWT